MKPSHLNKTNVNEHITTVLLQGCRGDQPSSVALALWLAPSSECQNMLKEAFRESVICDSVRVLEHLMELYRNDVLPLLPSGYTLAMKHVALLSLGFMMKHFLGTVPRTVRLPSFIEMVIDRGNAEALRQFLS
jgi:hypothetical protein